MNVFNRLVITEENNDTAITGGAWPGAVDPCNFVIGKYLREDAENVSFEISEDGKALYGNKYIKITNGGTSSGNYDMNNMVYFRVRIDDAGLEPGKTYTLFVFVKGDGLDEYKFKPDAIRLSASYCKTFSSDNQVQIGQTTAEDSGILKKSASFDWTSLALTFTCQSKEESAENNCICFSVSANNLGTISFDGIGLVEGSFKGGSEELKNLADRIFDSEKAEENELNALKERRMAQMRNSILYFYPGQSDNDYTKNIASAKSIEEVEKYTALFSSYLATGQEQNSGIPRKTAESYCEAVALKDTEWHDLRFTNIIPGSLYASKPPVMLVYGIATYKGSPLSVDLIEGIDYEIDYEKGKIRRTPVSTIPNAGDTGYYEYEDGSYVLGESSGSPNFREHTFYVSYSFDNGKCESYDDVLKKINKNNKTCAPKKLIKKLEKNDDELTYLVIGDSINTGAEAKEGFTFFDLFAAYMTENYGNPVKVINYAVGGETSHGGYAQMERAEADGVKPDVITIGFGMNDQNGEGVPMEDFDRNYSVMFKFAEEHWPDAQIIILTSIPACPIWNLTSGRDVEYAAELVKMGRKNHYPVADCNSLCHLEIEAGKHYAEVVTTGINHPGSYGHRMYYYAISSLFEVSKINPLYVIVPAVCIACGAAAGAVIISKKRKNNSKEKKDEQK